MSAVFSGNTPGAGGMCTDFDLNATELNSALENAEILTNGVLTLTKIDGSTSTNNIPYFADFVISGLNLTISNVPVNRTLTYTSGTYQINAQVYSIPVGANFQLTAGHPTLPRIDILYLTNTNNIIYQTGVPNASPVQPTAPVGTLLLAAIGVQINATIASNYTLVTVNTNASTIAPPTLTPGTVTGSHLYWDGLSWTENTFWNVGNSTFAAGARIHTYNDTDVNGVITTSIIGDGLNGRGFNFLVNDTLGGFSTNVNINYDFNDTLFEVLNTDFNTSTQSYISGSSSRNRIQLNNQTSNRECSFSQTDTNNSLSANVAFGPDPINNNNFSQDLRTTTSRIKQGTFVSEFIQDLTPGNEETTLSITDGTNTNEFKQSLLFSELKCLNGTGAESTLTITASPIPFISLKSLTVSGDYSALTTFGSVIGLESVNIASPNDNCIIRLNNGGNSGKIELFGGIVKKQRNTAVSTSILNNDWMIVATATPLTITLPATPVDGQELIIKITAATTNVNPVTINGNGKNIDGAATVVVGNAGQYTAVSMIFNSALNIWLRV